MPDIVKRLNYFDQQFLTEKDFIDEQNYHLDRRRRHNQFCHTFGIADGLEVTKIDAKKVQVSPGTAIDINGQEIVQDKDLTIDLSNATDFPANSTVYITIQYRESLSDRQISDKPGTETRFSEEPSINKSIISPPTDGTVIQLAKFTLTDQGNVPDGKLVKEEKDRQTVGAVLADRSVSTKQLKTEVKADLFNQDKALDLPPQGDTTKTPIVAFESPLEKLTSNNSTFLLVYAYSLTEGAKFKWDQEYTTEKRGNTTWVVQSVIFRNLSDINIKIKYKIYAVRES
jgi:hypothetical protein